MINLIQEGYLDFYKKSNKCPYVQGTTPYHEWYYGFNNAKRNDRKDEDSL